MAGLTKTFSGDLSTAIAGKLWEAIKDADERRELDKSKASEEVKQAAVKIKKEDPNSIPVQDKDLRETVVKIFGPIEGRLLQTQGKVDKLSGKITTVAGGIADTQKLLINQNQILEDKFDQMLKIVGTRGAIAKQKDAESKYKQLELELEKGLDLSGTFAFQKTGGRNTFGVLGSLFQFWLGRRFVRPLFKQLYKRIVPRSIRARARLLSRFAKPLRKVTRFARGSTSNILRATLGPVVKSIGQRMFRGGSRLAGKTMFQTIGTRFVGKTATATKNLFGAIGRKAKLIPSLLNRAILLKGTGHFNASIVADKIANHYANQAMLKAANLKRISAAKTLGTDVIGANKIAGEELMKKISKEGGKKIVKKTVSKSANELTEGALSKGLVEALNNPLVQRKLTEKLGKEGMEKIGLKLGAGGLKSFGVGPGTLYALGEGLMRLSPAFGGSDPLGMLLSFGSAIPWGGWGVAIFDVLRDIDRKAFDRHILPNLPAPSDQNIGAFFQEALQLEPNQLERGNIKTSGGMGGVIDSISEILGVTKAFGDAAGFGPEVKGLIGEAGLGSYPKSGGGYKFDVARGVRGGSIESTENKDIELKKKEKYTEEDDDDKPIIDDDRTSGEKIGDVVGATIDEVDTFLDPVRKITGGKRDDGVFTLPFGIEIRNPLNTKPKNEGGGIGGNDLIASHSSLVPHSHPTVRVDASGEPGVDFTPDGPNNRVIFDGQVTEIGHQYNPNVVGGDGRMGAGYGNYVVVTSVDPSNGEKFDGLYAHFPEGAIIPSVGDWVSHGDILGLMATAEDYANPDTRWHSGSGTGEHTSFDMLQPGTSRPYSNWRSLVSKIDSSFNSPYLMMPPLPPVPENIDTSSISPSGMSSFTTGMVEKGSNERMMTKRKIAKRLPIVIINNQVVNTSQTQIAMGNSKESGNFFEAYNLARYTV